MAGKATADEGQKVIAYELNGISGVWMPLDIANKVTTDAALVPLLQKKISELELLAALKQERFVNLQVGYELAETGRVLAVESQYAEETKRIAAEEKLKAWYRHPMLWFSVGIFIAVSAETALILSVD